MFDIGFSELVLIGVVALVVIGPERLPKVARTAGLLFGRFQRYIGNVRADITRELQLEEIQRASEALREEMQRAAQDVHAGLEASAAAAREAVQPPEPATTEVHPGQTTPAVPTAVGPVTAAPDVNEPATLAEAVAAAVRQTPPATGEAATPSLAVAGSLASTSVDTASPEPVAPAVHATPPAEAMQGELTFDTPLPSHRPE